MNIDPNVVLAIIAVIAVISPIATTLINNWYQAKIKKLEMFNESKILALNNFVEATVEVISSHDSEDLTEYFSSVNKLFIYFNNLTLDTFDDLSKSLKENNFSKANQCLTILVAYLSNQVQKG